MKIIFSFPASNFRTLSYISEWKKQHFSCSFYLQLWLFIIPTVCMYVFDKTLELKNIQIAVKHRECNVMHVVVWRSLHSFILIRLMMLYWLTIILFFLHAENASSPDYQELYDEFRSFVIKVTRANLKREVKVRFQPKTTRCADRCGEERSHTFYCHCDDNCQLTQDCCYDYLKM